LVLNDINEHGQIFYPTETLNVINDDADNRLLELAAASSADYLVTGNTNDFTMSVYENTKIVSPKE
jgi:predicted nucleic acid-binding protein